MAHRTPRNRKRKQKKPNWRFPTSFDQGIGAFRFCPGCGVPLTLKTSFGRRFYCLKNATSHSSGTENNHHDPESCKAKNNCNDYADEALRWCRPFDSQ